MSPGKPRSLSYFDLSANDLRFRTWKRGSEWKSGGSGMTKRVALGWCCLCTFLFLMFLVYSPAASGQAANSGTVAGTVTDQSGAAVVGATVTLVDTATNTERTAVTNDTGRYVCANVVPGSYNPSISTSRCRSAKFTKQVVSVG